MVYVNAQLAQELHQALQERAQLHDRSVAQARTHQLEAEKLPEAREAAFEALRGFTSKGETRGVPGDEALIQNSGLTDYYETAQITRHNAQGPAGAIRRSEGDRAGLQTGAADDRERLESTRQEIDRAAEYVMTEQTEALLGRPTQANSKAGTRASAEPTNQERAVQERQLFAYRASTAQAQRENAALMPQPQAALADRLLNDAYAETSRPKHLFRVDAFAKDERELATALKSHHKAFEAHRAIETSQSSVADKDAHINQIQARIVQSVVSNAGSAAQLPTNSKALEAFAALDPSNPRDRQALESFAQSGQIQQATQAPSVVATAQAAQATPTQAVETQKGQKESLVERSSRRHAASSSMSRSGSGRGASAERDIMAEIEAYAKAGLTVTFSHEDAERVKQSVQQARSPSTGMERIGIADAAKAVERHIEQQEQAKKAASAGQTPTTHAPTRR